MVTSTPLTQTVASVLTLTTANGWYWFMIFEPMALSYTSEFLVGQSPKLPMVTRSLMSSSTLGIVCV